MYYGIMVGPEDALAYKRGEPNGIVAGVRCNEESEYSKEMPDASNFSSLSTKGTDAPLPLRTSACFAA